MSQVHLLTPNAHTGKNTAPNTNHLNHLLTMFSIFVFHLSKYPLSWDKPTFFFSHSAPACV
jgi:hypothetical protein